MVGLESTDTHRFAFTFQFVSFGNDLGGGPNRME